MSSEYSDRFVDGLVAWGNGDALTERTHAHLDAGADHVTLQVLSAGDPGTPPLAEWRAVADPLITREGRELRRRTHRNSVASSAACGDHVVVRLIAVATLQPQDLLAQFDALDGERI